MKRTTVPTPCPGTSRPGGVPSGAGDATGLRGARAGRRNRGPLHPQRCALRGDVAPGGHTVADEEDHGSDALPWHLEARWRAIWCWGRGADGAGTGLHQLVVELVEQGRAQREGGHHTDHGADGGEQCDDERREAVTERPAPASHVTLHPPA